MAKRFTIENKSLFIDETGDSIDEFDMPISELSYDFGALDNEARVILFAKSGNVSGRTIVYEVLLSNAVDSASVAFTVATFKTFARLNFG